MKQIWDMSKHISFVFHQKSACQEVKPCKIEEETKEENEYIDEEDDDYEENDDPNDSDY